MLSPSARHTQASMLTLAGSAALAALSACAANRTSAPAEPAAFAPHIRGYTDDGNSIPNRPGPFIGQRIGDAAMLDADGRTVSLNSLRRPGPYVITFYRGGWCPYCDAALREWQGRVGELEAMGVRFYAVTFEKPDEAAHTADATGAEFTILSDHNHEAADRFRLRFTMDEPTRERYRAAGVNLPEMNAAADWDLPAPGTFVVDTNGVIRWAFADWDYTKRADPSEVIAAAREVANVGPTRRY
ncbi:MAG: peroxiredoxin-like family protein [Phycisphaerales bacterium]